MARLNPRPSTVASSRYASETPQPGSDQENRDPSAHPRAKGKERTMGPPSGASMRSLPTPPLDVGAAVQGKKRKRVEIAPDATQTEQDEEEDKFVRYFDPNQDPEVRRNIKRKSRLLEREFLENRDELLRDNGDGLTEIVKKGNHNFKRVKQTAEATIDSRMLVGVSDVARKKAAQLVLGDNSTGVDVDEFLSKCITYMRNGGPSDSQHDVGPSRRRQSRRADDDDEDEEVGDPLDWEILGRHACFPYNVRPPVPFFLLGPLSVEKKVRTQTQRRARQTKDTAGREARPEALSKDDLQQSDANSLTATCTKIRNQLMKHIHRGEQTLERAGFNEHNINSDAGKAMAKKCRVSPSGGVGLFDYVINPQSFGQTVENIFYISFLIKEGSVGVAQDDEEQPIIVPAEARTLEEQRKDKAMKHQAVFSIDYGTWQDLIEAFDIRESMIPHREEVEAAQIGSRGWYT